jgi:hypothetical membrane protein
MDIPAAAPSRFEKTALASGVAAPVLYFASVAAGAMMYPGFRVIRQFASDLGAQDAPHPLILNVGVVLSGVASLLGCVGLWLVLGRLHSRGIWRRWACATAGAQGMALVVAGLFPLPNWWHYVGSSLAFPAVLAPALVALALRQAARARRLRAYLVVNNVLMVLAYFAFVFGRGSNVLGLLQLLYTLLAIPWIAVAAVALLRLPNQGGAGMDPAQTDLPPRDRLASSPSRGDTTCRIAKHQVVTA